MKYIALIWIAFSGADLVAQSYIPLLDTSASWHDENAWTTTSGPSISSHECARYFLSGDTAINDTLYHRLLRSGVHSSSHTIFPSYIIWYWGELFALLREDTASRKVFIREPIYSQEFLLYDFSAGVGPYPWTFRFGETGYVTNVDTVMLIDGPHRRMDLGFNGQIIEGIGSTKGLLPSYVGEYFHWFGQLVCHMVTNTANYSDISLDDYCACGSNIGISDHRIKEIRIGPSPTTEFCFMEGAESRSPYQIFAIDGSRILSGTCSDNGSTIIDLSAVNTGLYIVEVIESTGVLKFKIVKE